MQDELHRRMLAEGAVADEQGWHLAQTAQKRSSGARVDAK